MSTRTPGAQGRGAAATLRWSGGSVSLPVGGTALLGRAPTAHVRIGRDDPFVSRRACAVVDLGDCLWVRNLSTSKPVTLRRTVGEDVVVEPGRGATTTPGEGAFQLLFVGRHRPDHHVVRVEPGERRPARAPSPTDTHAPLALSAALGVAAVGPNAGGAPNAPVTPVAPVARVASVAEVTLTRPARLTPAEQRVLDALVLPMTSHSGPAAAPATYAQMEAMLGLKSSYLRNVIRRIRDKYTAAGVADLSVDDGVGHGLDVRRGLALWEYRARRATAS